MDPPPKAVPGDAPAPVPSTAVPFLWVSLVANPNVRSNGHLLEMRSPTGTPLPYQKSLPYPGPGVPNPIVLLTQICM